jgi:hypothetical protein
MPIIDESKKYNPSGKMVTASLFKEFSQYPEYVAMSVSRKDKDLPSFPELYLKYCKDDPSEYTFAIEVFGDWHWWENIRKISKLRPYITELRNEIEVYLKAKGFKAILREVKEGGRSAFTAAKFLVDKGWEPTPSRSKKAKEQEEMIIKAVDQEVAEDAERLGFLKVVK